MKIAVLGCGTMSSALIIPMQKMDHKLEIWTYTPSRIRAQALAETIGGTVLEDVKDLSSFDLIFLGCKPQQFKDLCHNVGGLHNEQTVISILAGVKISNITENLSVSSVFRMMPNTPCMVGHGVSIVFTSHDIISQHKSYLIGVFRAASNLFIVNREEDIDKITPVSGSGPAFLFELARLMEKDLKDIDVPSYLIRDIVAHTFLGSAKLMQQSDKSFERLREDVTSKKGVTYEALEEFKRSDLEDIVKRALKKARQRIYELSNL